MRLSAAKALGWKEIPCIILSEDMPADKLKEIVIKDNGSFGEWDMDVLANEWDDLPLSDWGVNMNWDTDPHYCDVIIARWEKLTGKKAEKVG